MPVGHYYRVILTYLLICALTITPSQKFQAGRSLVFHSGVSVGIRSGGRQCSLYPDLFWGPCPQSFSGYNVVITKCLCILCQPQMTLSVLVVLSQVQQWSLTKRARTTPPLPGGFVPGFNHFNDSDSK